MEENIKIETIEKLSLNKFTPIVKHLSKNPEDDLIADNFVKTLETELENHEFLNNNEKIKIVDIKNTPEYLIDNEFILSGYRVQFNSFLKILKR